MQHVLTVRIFNVTPITVTARLTSVLKWLRLAFDILVSWEEHCVLNTEQSWLIQGLFFFFFFFYISNCEPLNPYSPDQAILGVQSCSATKQTPFLFIFVFSHIFSAMWVLSSKNTHLNVCTSSIGQGFTELQLIHFPHIMTVCVQSG